MAYGSARPPGPKLDVFFDDLLPYYSVLKDGTAVELQRIISGFSASSGAGATAAAAVRANVRHDGAGRRGAVCTDPRTVRAIHNLLNYEIAQGNSYPFEHALPGDKFDEYFFGYDAFVLRTVDPSPPQTRANGGNYHYPCHGVAAGAQDDGVLTLPDPQFVGCFYVKPNYPGRSAHICNGGFLVSPLFRKLGAGLLLGERFRVVAQRLQYRGSVFNLVFHDNPASLRLWQTLGFTRVGVIPGAGRHPVTLGRGARDDPHQFVSATVWFLDLSQPLTEIFLPWERDHREAIARLRQRTEGTYREQQKHRAQQEGAAASKL